MTVRCACSSSPRKALCGRDIGWFEWAFVDAEHMKQAAENASLIRPCKRCLARIDAEPAGREGKA